MGWVHEDEGLCYGKGLNICICSLVPRPAPQLSSLANFVRTVTDLCTICFKSVHYKSVTGI